MAPGTYKTEGMVARTLTIESGDTSYNGSAGSGDDTRLPFLRRQSRLKIRLEDDIRNGLEGDTRSDFILRCYLLVAGNTNVEANPLKDIAWTASTEGTGAFFNFFTGHSIAASLDTFDYELARYSESSLRICAINAGTAVEQRLSLYPFIESIRLHTESKAETAAQVVPILIKYLLRKNWNIENTALHLDPIVMKSYIPSKLQLPSTSLAKASRVFDPLKGGDLEWRWLRHCPTYESDINVYVWQPYATLPKLDVVQMHIQPPASNNQQSILLTVSSKDALHRVKTNYINADIPALTNVQDQLYAFLAMMYDMIRMDVLKFRDDAIQQTAHMALQIRQSPSSSKITYLLHLQECYRYVAEHCRKNKETLVVIREAFRRNRSQPLPPSCLQLYDILQTFETCEEDLVFLAEELTIQSRGIDEMNTRIRQLMDIKDKWRTQLVTILVTIYVPLAFATSYYGMNVGHLTDNIFWVNTTTLPTAENPGSLTSTLTSTNQLGPNILPEWEFWVTALTLTFGSIIIPTTVGPVYREAIQFAHRNNIIWRIIVFSTTIVIVAAISFACFYGKFKINDVAVFDTRMLNLSICIIVGSYFAWYLFMAISLRNLELFGIWILLLVCFILAIGGQSWFPLGGALAVWFIGLIVISLIWYSRPNALFNLVEYRRQRERAARERQLQTNTL